jgi:hypothetical protein
MIQPEYRIYLIGIRVFAFAVITTSLDYRVKQDVTLRLVDPSWLFLIAICCLGFHRGLHGGDDW